MSNKLLEKSTGLGMRLSNKIANMGFVCACLVVLIHSPMFGNVGFVTYLLKNFLVRIAVPAFFMISGFLLARHCGEEGWYCREVCKRVKTLLVPLWCWCLI